VIAPPRAAPALVHRARRLPGMEGHAGAEARGGRGGRPWKVNGASARAEGTFEFPMRRTLPLTFLLGALYRARGRLILYIAPCP
jgi:hypothetical protein